MSSDLISPAVMPISVPQGIQQRIIELDDLGDLGEHLIRAFGPDIRAIVIVKRTGDSPEPISGRYELKDMSHPRRWATEPVARRVVNLLGVNPGLLGHRYLVEALVVIAEEWPRVMKITEGVYAMTAKRFGCNAGSVERGIRHAIESTARKNPDHFAAIMGRTGEDGRRPTNTDALFRLLELLQDDLRGGRP